MVYRGPRNRLSRIARRGGSLYITDLGRKRGGAVVVSHLCADFWSLRVWSIRMWALVLFHHLAAIMWGHKTSNFWSGLAADYSACPRYSTA